MKLSSCSHAVSEHTSTGLVLFSCPFLLYSIPPMLSYKTSVKRAVSTLSLAQIKSILANVYKYAIEFFASFCSFLGDFHGRRWPFTFLQLHLSDLATERESQLMAKKWAERTLPCFRFPILWSAIGHAVVALSLCMLSIISLTLY